MHLFLHPGAEDLQTVEESVAERTIRAVLAARDDLMAGFTGERDMGTEGAGPADSAVRNAINAGWVPGPRMLVSGNAVDILSGHEDAIGYNPEQHVLPNATHADSAAELVKVIREQFKQGADFIKIYQTGKDALVDGKLVTPYQYTEAELSAAVREAARVGKFVAVHATGEPGTLYAAQAGVVSVEHADVLGDETMRIMREKGIFAVPTFTISEYFAQHSASREKQKQMLELHAREFRKQLAAGLRFAMGSDVGPFPHGTQGREFVLMVEFGMKPLDAIQAGYGQCRQTARVAGPCRRTEAGLLGRHRGGGWRSARGHYRTTACQVRDEGRRRLQALKPRSNRNAACRGGGRGPEKNGKLP